MNSPVTPIDEAKMLKDIAEANKDGYFMRCAKALDVFINVVVLRGYLGETISSHSARAAREGRIWGVLLAKALDWFDSNHSVNAQASDIAAAETVIAAEESSGLLPNTVHVTDTGK